MLPYVGHLFSRATNFANGAKKGVRGNYFHETTLAELFTIHMNLHTMEFPLIFSEPNFVEVPKIHEIYGSQKRAPYGITNDVNAFTAIMASSDTTHGMAPNFCSIKFS